MKTPFEQELESLINRHSRENGSNTPDFILARYMLACLEAFEEATQKRDSWYDIAPEPGITFTPDPEEIGVA